MDDSPMSSPQTSAALVGSQRREKAKLFSRRTSTVPKSTATNFLALCIVAAASYMIILGETRLAHMSPQMSNEVNKAALAVINKFDGPPSPPARRASDIPKSSQFIIEPAGAEPFHHQVAPLDRSYRRVVDLTPHEHLLYQGRQKNLCKLLRRVEGGEEGRRRTANRKGNVKSGVLLNMTTSCRDWGNKRTVGSLGVGNLVLGLYAVRLAATMFGFDLLFQCTEENDHVASGRAVDKIGPFRWLQGHFIASEDGERNLLPPPERGAYSPPLPSRNRTCKGMGSNPVHYMSELVRSEFRTMAVDIFGPRNNLPESARYQTGSDRSSTASPAPLAGAPLDDVAIHLRCGDILYNGGKHYGFLPFQSYVSRLGNDFAGTIGIVTIPFEPELLRGRDKGGAKACLRIVTALVRYLRTRLPNAAVSVRNGPDETAAVSMARLVMANTTFCGPTTFGLFPSIASFGTAYVHSGTTNYFIPKVAERYDDVIILDEPILTSVKMKKMSMNETVSWLLGKAKRK